MHSEAKQTKVLEFGAEKVLLQGPCMENAETHAQKTRTPDQPQGSIFKGKVREGSHSMCDQLVHDSLVG